MTRLLYSARWSYLLLFPLLVGIVSCNSDDEGGTPVRPDENLVDILSETEGLDSMEVLIDLYNEINSSTTLTSRLSSSEHTIFAPNNAAFVKLLESIGLASLSELRSDLLTSTLLYHIVPNIAYASSQVDSTLTNMSTSQLMVSMEGDSIRLNASTQPERTVVVTPNLQASNGVIHVINEVLLPAAFTASSSTIPSIVSTFGTVAGLTSTVGVFGGVSTINSVFTFAGFSTLLSGTSPYTVLTPIDGAFDNFFFTSEQNITDVANYHIIEGNFDFTTAGRTITTLGGKPLYVTNDEGSIFLNGIFAGDFGFTASNGRIVHMAGVLKPAAPLMEMISYVESITGSSFTIFRTALEDSDITIGENRTIFMPTDAAFEAAGLVVSIDSASRLDPALLTSVLQTHVFEGMNFSSDIVVAEKVESNALNGTPLTITLVPGENGSSITVDDENADTETAQFVDFDYLTNNGVLHVVNQVLLPNP